MLLGILLGINVTISMTILVKFLSPYWLPGPGFHPNPYPMSTVS